MSAKPQPEEPTMAKKPAAKQDAEITSEVEKDAVNGETTSETTTADDAPATEPEAQPETAADAAAASDAAIEAALADKGTVVFESREVEPVEFDVAGISPMRDFSNGRLIWTVEADDADRFSRHHHCQVGRIVRKNGGK
jgi:hypothetical protein